MVCGHIPLGFVERDGCGFGDSGEWALIARDSPRHAFGAQCDAAVDDAKHDSLGDPMEGLHAGAALPVGVESRGFRRKTGHPSNTSHVHKLSVA